MISYNYIYKDHRDIESEKAAYTVKAASFIKEFQLNEAEATTKYLNKTIEIEGTLSSIDENSVVLEELIFFALNKNETPPTTAVSYTHLTLPTICSV